MKTLALLYDAAGHDRKVDDLDKVDPSSLGPEQLLWVDVSEFDDGQLHGLPPHLPVAEVSLEELGSLQIFDDHYRFAIPLHDKEQSQLGFVVGKTWLLTLSKVRPSFFDDFVEADKGETLKGRMSPTALTATLLMRQLDSYRNELALVDTAIDKLDETILRSREKRTPLGVLAALRRRVAGLRAGLGHQRDVIHSLIGPTSLRTSRLPTSLFSLRQIVFSNVSKMTWPALAIRSLEASNFMPVGSRKIPTSC